MTTLGLVRPIKPLACSLLCLSEKSHRSPLWSHVVRSRASPAKSPIFFARAVTRGGEYIYVTYGPTVDGVWSGLGLPLHNVMSLILFAVDSSVTMSSSPSSVFGGLCCRVDA